MPDENSMLWPNRVTAASFGDSPLMTSSAFFLLDALQIESGNAVKAGLDFRQHAHSALLRTHAISELRRCGS